MKLPIQRDQSGDIKFVDYLRNISQRQATDLLAEAHTDGVLFCEFRGHLLMGLTAAAKYFELSPRALRQLLMNYPRLFGNKESIRFTGVEKDHCEKALNEPQSHNKIVEALTPIGVLRIATLSTGALPEKLCGQLALIQEGYVDNTFDEETLDGMKHSDCPSGVIEDWNEVLNAS